MRQLPAATATNSVGVHFDGELTTHWGEDDVAVEVPVALIFNCVSHVVMMVSPVDLEDFAYGFSLSEEIIKHPKEIESVHILPNKHGITLRIRIAEKRFTALKERRRNMVGRTGCGLCGTETLQQAIRPIPQVRPTTLTDDAIQSALAGLRQQQPLNAVTGATHAAAWCDLSGNILVCREDVGRHNALDKLIGLISVQHVDVTQGFVLVSSRASYEMVQKTCQAGIGALVAISAPTSLAIEQAQHAGLMLVGFARSGRHIVYNQVTCADQPPLRSAI